MPPLIEDRIQIDPGVRLTTGSWVNQEGRTLEIDVVGEPGSPSTFQNLRIVVHAIRGTHTLSQDGLGDLHHGLLLDESKTVLLDIVLARPELPGQIVVAYGHQLGPVLLRLGLLVPERRVVDLVLSTGLTILGYLAFQKLGHLTCPPVVECSGSRPCRPYARPGR